MDTRAQALRFALCGATGGPLGGRAGGFPTGAHCATPVSGIVTPQNPVESQVLEAKPAGIAGFGGCQESIQSSGIQTGPKLVSFRGFTRGLLGIALFSSKTTVTRENREIAGVCAGVRGVAGLGTRSEESRFASQRSAAVKRGVRVGGWGRAAPFRAVFVGTRELTRPTFQRCVFSLPRRMTAPERLI